MSRGVHAPVADGAASAPAQREPTHDAQPWHSAGPVAASPGWPAPHLSNHAVSGLLGTPPAHGHGPLTGIDRPDAATIAQLAPLLRPSVTADGSLAPWDRQEKALGSELATAIGAILAETAPRLAAARGRRAVSVHSLEGPVEMARQVLLDAFGPLVALAALTPRLAAVRARPALTAGHHLRDAGRRHVDALDVARGMTATLPSVKAVLTAHHLDPNRSWEERFALDRTLRAISAAHRQELVDTYLLRSDGRAVLETGDLWLHRALDEHALTLEPAAGQRAHRWHVWGVALHEILHLLAHPAFHAAVDAALQEGSCELLRIEVLEKVIPIAKADGDPQLRAGIEGRDADGGLLPGFDPAFVEEPSSAYAEFVATARQVEALTSPEALRAAYFLGHVELIGLSPRGGVLPARTDAPGTVVRPAGASDLSALATITGSSIAAIRSANPGLADDDPLPPTVIVPGTRYHTVIDVAGGGAGHRTETVDEIAACYGMAGAAVRRANPGIDGRRLRVGQQILIPVEPGVTPTVTHPTGSRHSP